MAPPGQREEAEAVIETYVFAALALVCAGVTIGILVMICLGIKRDDRPGGFPADTDDRIARVTRKMTGAACQTPSTPHRSSNRSAPRQVRN